MRRILSMFLIVLVLVMTTGTLTSCSCEHEELTEATCDKPAKCQNCGENIGEATNEHLWSDATCKTPQTCELCGKTEGKVLDEHKWIEATCYEPRTCKVCGKTEGEKIAEHMWLPADCETPSRCKFCDDTNGEPLGHTWVDATYDDPKTCTTCLKTEGNPKIRPDFEATLKNTVPLTITNYYSSGRMWNSVYFSDVKIDYEKTYDGKNNIILYFTGEKIYDENGSGQSRTCSVGIKIYDEEGYVVADDTYYTADLKVGDKFKNDEYKIYEDLTDGIYVIELLNTN